MRKKFVFSLLSLLSFSFIFSSCDKEEETQLSSSHLLLTTYICETSDENSYPPEYTDEKLIEPEPNSNIELPP